MALSSTTGGCVIILHEITMCFIHIHSNWINRILSTKAYNQAGTMFTINNKEIITVKKNTMVFVMSKCNWADISETLKLWLQLLILHVNDRAYTKYLMYIKFNFTLLSTTLRSRDSCLKIALVKLKDMPADNFFSLFHFFFVLWLYSYKVLPQLFHKLRTVTSKDRKP